MQLDTARQWSALATISFLPCKKECWRGSVVVVPHPLHAGCVGVRGPPVMASPPPPRSEARLVNAAPTLWRVVYLGNIN